MTIEQITKQAYTNYWINADCHKSIMQVAPNISNLDYKLVLGNLRKLICIPICDVRRLQN